MYCLFKVTARPPPPPPPPACLVAADGDDTVDLWRGLVLLRIHIYIYVDTNNTMNESENVRTEY